MDVSDFIMVIICIIAAWIMGLGMGMNYMEQEYQTQAVERNYATFEAIDATTVEFKWNNNE